MTPCPIRRPLCWKATYHTVAAIRRLGEGLKALIEDVKKIEEDKALQKISPQ
jgi:hypothetical protein